MSSFQNSILLFATVKDTKDPLKLGRVQVELKSLDKPVELPWIRVLQSQASKGFGMMVLPEIGDMVAVLRGAGPHIHSMLVLGGVYDKKHLPPIADTKGKNNEKMFKSREGHTFSFSDEAGKTKIDIVSAKGIGIKIDDKAEKMSIAVKDIKLDLDGKGKSFKIESPDKIVLKGKKIELNADDIVIKGKNVQLMGQMKVLVKGKDVVLKADMNTKIDGLKIAIKAGAVCDIKGGAKVSVKGAITSVG